MVLEATILCLDNSDWARNGDYEPSRWDTQINAANLIIENRCDKNPENALGIITMAGKRVEVHSTLTNDESRILGAIRNIDLSSECDFVTALNISTLTLKHRMNKNQKQRIILFVGSPIKHTANDLETTGKKLKKYNISVDIISFGHTEQNRELLTVFLNSVNNAGSSSLIEVPVGGYIMEALLNSAILGESQPIEQGGNNGGGRVQQEGVGLSQFERDLNLAMQMSLQESNKDTKQTGTGQGTDKGMEEYNEEEELEKARLLSLQENANVIKKKNDEKEKELRSEALESPDFIKDILEEVTSNKVKDEEIKDIVDQIKNEKAKEKEKNKEEKNKEEKNKEEKNKEEKNKDEKKNEDSKEKPKDDKMDVDKPYK